jgi:hypothetical protein
LYVWLFINKDEVKEGNAYKASAKKPEHGPDEGKGQNGRPPATGISVYEGLGTVGDRNCVPESTPVIAPMCPIPG